MPRARVLWTPFAPVFLLMSSCAAWYKTQEFTIKFLSVNMAWWAGLIALIFTILRYLISVILPGLDSLDQSLKKDTLKHENGEGNDGADGEADPLKDSDFFSLVVPDWLFNKDLKGAPPDKNMKDESMRRHCWSCERKVCAA